MVTCSHYCLRSLTVRFFLSISFSEISTLKAAQTKTFGDLQRQMKSLSSNVPSHVLEDEHERVSGFCLKKLSSICVCFFFQSPLSCCEIVEC